MQPGFYIAWHRWFDQEFGPGNLHKVGETGSLTRRLQDSGYQTCWPDDFTYVATLETQTKEDAQQIEAGVLFAARHWRIGDKELVNLTAAELYDLASSIASALGIKVVARLKPVYEQQAPTRTKSEPIVKIEAAPPLIDTRTLEHLTVPNKVERQKKAAAVDTEMMDSFIDELIEEVSLPLPPKPAETKKPVVSSIAMAASAAFTAIKAVAVSATQMVKPSPLRAAPLPADEDEPLDDYIMLDERGQPLDGGYRPIALENREYQNDAAEASLYELKRSSRAVLQCCCRGGKTRIAHMVIGHYLAADGRALWLVPGLALLRQTAQKLASYGEEVRIPDLLLIGSDSVSIDLGDGVSVTMTTDRESVVAFLKEHPRALIISTYQSSAIVPDDTEIAITILDEAHRTAGGKKARPFNHTLLLKRPGHQLAMTATPSYGKELSMDDTSLYGGIAFRYYLADAIKAGYVNPFRLELVAAGVEKGVSATGPTAEALLVQQIVAASEKVDKLLTFCGKIAQATRLCQAVSLALAADHPATRCLVAHSKMSKRDQNQIIQDFSAGGVKAILFNVRLYTEGVECPLMDGVFFAAPRHSPLDIIQAICRPLTKIAGKQESVVFLPVLVEKGKPITDPSNLERFASIVPFCDALMEEQPALYEHLLNPKDKPYPITVLGTKSLGLTTDTARKTLLAAVRKAVRYNGNGKTERLTRADRIPWQEGFAELRRIVTECDRYPKTTDAWFIGEAKVAFHHWYRFCADQYTEWRDGRPTKLEPYQLRDLETLPHWDTFGLSGPYPWEPCVAFLEQWLSEHDGVPPMVEINKGGFVGLDASAIERLSGCLTCINQGDGRDRANSKKVGSGFTVDKKRQDDLDRICAKYGLRWRKERDADGALVEGGQPSFIQEAYSRFKDYYSAFKAGKNDGSYINTWFSGYPLKHSKMQKLGTPKDVLPPRWKTGRRAKKTN